MKISELHKPTLPLFSNQAITSWDFLVTSRFHSSYVKQAPYCSISLITGLNALHCHGTTVQVVDQRHQGEPYYTEVLMEILDSLHSLYENLKLNNLRKKDLWRLASLLCRICVCLSEASYVDFYVRDFPCLVSEVHFLQSTAATRAPPNLLRWLEICLRCGCLLADPKDLPFLILKENSTALCWSRKVVCFFSLLLGAERNGKKLSSGVYCNIANGTARTPEELTVLAMVAERFGHQHLDLLPIGVSLPIRHALDACRESPPSDWPAAAYVLIGREDLAMIFYSSLNEEEQSQSNANLPFYSPTYRLHVRPVAVPFSASENKNVDSTKLEDTDAPKSVEDGMEHIFNSSAQLRFGRDLRLNEVRRLLCSARPVAIQTPANPTATDQDFQQVESVATTVAPPSLNYNWGSVERIE
ncbi:hypothetical protein HPP92_012038 [Vanilla planifolia]|uniref:Anaphase-promoting complex subunit 1 middle domain-containing protein n=1 Tax=Vanilla planifolia TaxID=51239 RepID=A0A835V2D5_VANPL|nr:hypothetical protein HPP92_012038 [Vanilla planifolia]